MSTYVNSKRAAKALEASIKHWEENVRRAKFGLLNLRHISQSDCALCKLYNQPDNEHRCSTACPVKRRSGRDFCLGTPYRYVRRALVFNEVSVAVANAAKEELKFLKSLRTPEGK